MKSRKCANIPVCRLQIVLLIIKPQKYFTVTNLRTSEPSHSGLLFMNGKQERLPCELLSTLLPHTLALFMRSLTQTAGHKMAPVMVVFS